MTFPDDLRCDDSNENGKEESRQANYARELYIYIRRKVLLCQCALLEHVTLVTRRRVNLGTRRGSKCLTAFTPLYKYVSKKKKFRRVKPKVTKTIIN